jgi:DNA-binding CsgD family transcriptional regulator
VYSQAWTFVLIAAGDLAAAAQVSAAGLDQAREASDLWNQSALLPRIADLDLRAGRTGDAAAHLREGLPLAVRTGNGGDLLAGLEACGTLCPATGRYASPDGMGRVRRAPAARGRHRAGLDGGGSRCGDELGHGRTNGQIAAHLYISARTVSSHLDRIRDKTGCRRRADLTRLALAEGLV